MKSKIHFSKLLLDAAVRSEPAFLQVQSRRASSRISAIRKLTEQRNDEEREEGRRRSSSSWREYLFFGVPAIITFYLGIWQTRRFFWKQELIADRENRVSENPIVYNPSTFSVDDMLYHVIELTGEFDHSREVFVGLRTSPDAKREYIATNRNSGGEMGYYVITPFVTTSGNIFWVNRGWIPRQFMEQEKRKDTIIKGILTIYALVREEERQASFAGVKVDIIVRDNWFSTLKPSIFTEKYLKDQTAKVEKCLLDQVDLNEEISYQTNILQKKSRYDPLEFYVMPEKHIVYMITWYGMCAWILATWGYFKKGRLRK